VDSGRIGHDHDPPDVRPGVQVDDWSMVPTDYHMHIPHNLTNGRHTLSATAGARTVAETVGKTVAASGFRIVHPDDPAAGRRAVRARVKMTVIIVGGHREPIYRYSPSASRSKWFTVRYCQASASGGGAWMKGRQRW
jgi:hypothetical protein